MTTPDSIDAHIRGVVNMLLAINDLKPIDLVEADVVKGHTLYRRLQSGKWLASELAAIADYFGVPADAFLQGPSALMREDVTLSTRRFLSDLPSASDLLARAA